jgi:CRP-like cAMP-binding protein
MAMSARKPIAFQFMRPTRPAVSGRVRDLSPHFNRDLVPLPTAFQPFQIIHAVRAMGWHLATLLVVRDMHALARKLRNLATVRDEELQAFVAMFSVKRSIRRGADIIAMGDSSTFSTVLLQGLACRYKIIGNGRRQILTFQYPGDFCDGHSYILPTRDTAVCALTDCSVGIIMHRDIERITAKFPSLGLALWRDTMIEASIFREWNVSQRPALERIAHMLCEQIVRLEAIGVAGRAIPQTQVDLADAAGLSTVHMNRTIQDLRELGVLMKNSRPIMVSHWDRLVEIAKFDGRYLGMWQVPSNELSAVSTRGEGIRPAM